MPSHISKEIKGHNTYLNEDKFGHQTWKTVSPHVHKLTDLYAILHRSGILKYDR